MIRLNLSKYIYFFIISLPFKAFKSKSTLRLNLNCCFYYNMHTVILITTCKPDPVLKTSTNGEVSFEL